VKALDIAALILILMLELQGTTVMAQTTIDAPPASPAAPAASQSQPRIGAPPKNQLDTAGRAEYEAAIKGFGAPSGPRMPLLNSPDVLQAWSDMQKALSASKLPPVLRELAILTVAAYWRSEFEWYVHSASARRQGISPEVIEAIRHRQIPKFTDDDQRVVFDYTRELIDDHEISDATYQTAWKLLGTRTLVDLTVLIGHYTSVSMTLNAHHVPIPGNVASAFGQISR
jgi:4-carboxymuconolactone decarboxylase